MLTTALFILGMFSVLMPTTIAVAKTPRLLHSCENAHSSSVAKQNENRILVQAFDALLKSLNIEYIEYVGGFSKRFVYTATDFSYNEKLIGIKKVLNDELITQNMLLERVQIGEHLPGAPISIHFQNPISTRYNERKVSLQAWYSIADASISFVEKSSQTELLKTNVTYFHPPRYRILNLHNAEKPTFAFQDEIVSSVEIKLSTAMALLRRSLDTTLRDLTALRTTEPITGEREIVFLETLHRKKTSPYIFRTNYPGKVEQLSAISPDSTYGDQFIAFQSRLRSFGYSCELVNSLPIGSPTPSDYPIVKGGVGYR